MPDKSLRSAADWPDVTGALRLGFILTVQESVVKNGNKPGACRIASCGCGRPVV